MTPSARQVPPDLVYDVATTVQRRLDEVARYLFDPRTMPEWSAVLHAVEEPDDQSLLRRGRHLRANLQVLGTSLTVEGHLEGLSLKDRRGAVEIRPLDGDGAIHHELELVDRDPATVVHFRNRVVPPTWLADTVSADLLQTYVEATAHVALTMIKAVLHTRQEGELGEAGRRDRQQLGRPEQL